MTERRPALSVVLQVGGERARAAECLASLLGQGPLAAMEILLLDYDREQGMLPGADHPAVQLLERPAYESIGFGRAFGVEHARAPVVAFIEDHCVALDGWADAILAAHAQGWKAIGCEMHNGNPGIGISDSIALMNYARWLPPARRGVDSLLAGHNVAYDRELLLSFGERLPELLCSDPLLQWKMQQAGYQLFLEPAMKVAHKNETDIATIARGYYYWNRVFAINRAALFSWSTPRKLLWLVMFPFIPPVRIFKLMLYLLRERPRLLGTFVRSLPVQLAAQYAAAFGQAVGFTFGAGDAATAFLEYELNQPRRES